MYAVGESFDYTVEDLELNISVIGDIMAHGEEYLIGEDLDGLKYVFIYREDEELVEMIDDEDDSSEILEIWEDEYYAGGTDIGDWDGDSFYEREDGIAGSSDETSYYFEADETFENYTEVENYSELEEDVESFISELMGG